MSIATLYLLYVGKPNQASSKSFTFLSQFSYILRLLVTGGCTTVHKMKISYYQTRCTFYVFKRKFVNFISKTVPLKACVYIYVPFHKSRNKINDLLFLLVEIYRKEHDIQHVSYKLLYRRFEIRSIRVTFTSLTPNFSTVPKCSTNFPRQRFYATIYTINLTKIARPITTIMQSVYAIVGKENVAERNGRDDKVEIIYNYSVYFLEVLPRTLYSWNSGRYSYCLFGAKSCFTSC